jgi:hypothetical protein
MMKSAIISPDGLYRYRLERRWDEFASKKFTICWIMLNPSTADASKDDPTIRKCVGFSRRWGFGGMIVVNLYAFRATSVRDLKIAIGLNEAVGPENENHVYLALDDCDRAMVAWGANAPAPPVQILKVLKKHCRAIDCFQPLTKNFQPPHPLMLPYDSLTDEWAR